MNLPLKTTGGEVDEVANLGSTVVGSLGSAYLGVDYTFQFPYVPCIIYTVGEVVSWQLRASRDHFLQKAAASEGGFDQMVEFLW